MQQGFAPNFSGKYTVTCQDVDLRDGFSVAFFEADIILTATPPQTHLAKGQKVVTELNNLFYQETNFRKHYEPVESFRLDRGVTATLWLKTTPLEREDFITVRDLFEKFYPDHPELFRDRIIPRQL